MHHHLLNAYEQLPSPKWVITLGDCPTLKNSFEKTYAIIGDIDKHIPVSYHIPGCPPEPREIIKGFLEFIKKM